MKLRTTRLLILFCLFWQYSLAQCNDKLLEVAAMNLKEYNYVKDIKVRLPKAKKNSPLPFHKVTLILNRGVRYRFYTTDAKENESKMIAELYNNEILIASTFNKTTGKHYEAIEIEIGTTAPYFLILYFEDGKEGCGVAIQSMETEEQRHNRGKL